MLDRVYPLFPRNLPDGSVVWEERGKVFDVQAAVRAYDERMSLLRNFEHNTWEVWRADEDGVQSRCGLWEGDRCPEPREVLDHLLGHDVWRGYDPLADLDREEAKREAALDAAVSDIALRSADRMHYELVDEFSAHMPAARPIGMHSKGRHKRVDA